MVNSVGGSISAVIQNAALIGVNVIVAGTVVSLAALTIMENFEDTPEVRDLSCFVGVPRADCPKYQDALSKAQEELEETLQAKKTLDERLDGLRAIQTSVDEITMFQTYDDPNSAFDVVVGTVYTQFVEARPSPKSHFCYIQLSNGKAGESRNLYFRGSDGARNMSAKALNDAGVSFATLQFGRSVCKPFLIGSSES